ncbi:uncharacterized protein LOC110839032 isoform X2 [Zootermopsis nevadensis]|uniref:FERM domain-containing protein 4A n=1 Tax=Zootermopsis nevadensis TaxID=136037 RepID=A0A067QLQ4_ZOONE|nr:uncharacterized protein LOC110839032 isoform X2 [Zootermopsis nevadensis]KDR09046.1 FERM domain-containing protein 4A [Zootermopsis nevadensis]
MSESEGREQERGSVRDMVATLQARREELETKLNERNQELKLLCIQEAELTGVLPPETPMEPGEFPPVFRRRVGTAFTYPENLINDNKLKSKEEETLTALELECKIQKGIAEAALGLANDTAASKTARRKHRLMYQQSRRRLLELEAKFDLLQQSSKSQHPKQRKKPRPPLDSDVENIDRDVVGDALSHDGGVSLSPLSPEAVSVESHQYWDIRHSATYDGLSRHAMRDIKGAHPQLQRHGSGGLVTSSGFGNVHYMQQYVTLGSELENHRPKLEIGPTPTSASTLPGYWMRHDYGPYVEVDSGTRLTSAPMPRYLVPQTPTHAQSRWNQERKRWDHDRFGSLDRRKAAAPSHSSSSPCLESWSSEDLEIQSQMQGHQGVMYGVSKYGHTSTHHSILCPAVETKQSRSDEPHIQQVLHSTRSVSGGGGGALLPNQTYPEHSLGMDGRGGGLLRTQSLGSVDPQPTDTLNRKHKEKEWYETSLDAAPSQVPQEPQSRPASSLRKRSPEPGGPATSDASSNLSRSSSNVSSEQRPQFFVHHVSASKNETFDTVVPFESPKNHTVVQAGKWQPYREVTKPFEMSDFYKYSTKFRKNQEMGRSSLVPCPDYNSQQPSYNASSPGSHTHVLNGPAMCLNRGPHLETPTPQQKGIYQPLQPMTCQPLDPSTRSRVVSPNASLDGSLVLGSGESLADAFSTEMLAWYQDQNIPRSATLV